MTIQTLNDSLLAIAVTVGISVALAIVMVVAGRFYERSKAQAGQAVRAIAVPAQHPTQTDDVRDLVLR